MKNLKEKLLAASRERIEKREGAIIKYVDECLKDDVCKILLDRASNHSAAHVTIFFIWGNDNIETDIYEHAYYFSSSSIKQYLPAESLDSYDVNFIIELLEKYLSEEDVRWQRQKPTEQEPTWIELRIHLR